MIIANQANINQNQLISLKISLLKQSVYPKKRSFTVKSKSLKVFTPRKQLEIEKVFPSQEKNIQEENTNQEPLSGRSSNSLKMTTLEFKSKRSLSNQGVAWTVQNWMPRHNGVTMRAHSRPLFKEQDKQKQFLKKITCLAPEIEKKIQRKYCPKDAQSLLRKNSLFLLNFIKSRQKKSMKMAHVGNVPLILDKIEYNKGYHQEKTKIERQKKMVNYIKLWKQDTGFQKQVKTNNQPHLYPQPW